MTRITAKNIEKILRQRLQEAVYADGVLPSERSLANEFGVARPTVRKALDALLHSGIIARRKNGRLQNEHPECNKMRVGYFIPVLNSDNYYAHYLALEQAAEDTAVQIQTVFYGSWHDPVLCESYNIVDALILIPCSDLPEWMIRKLHSLKKPILILEWDLSKLGFLSFSLFPRHGLRVLLNYLIEQGYHDIDLLSVIPLNPVAKTRREEWRNAIAEVSGTGRFWDFSSNGGVLPFQELRRIFRKHIQDGAFDFRRPLLCVTMAAATVFARAARDCGLTAGIDYSLAAFDGELQAEYHTPAITSLERTDPYSYFKYYLDWLQRSVPWEGSLFWEADQVILQKGESIILSKNTER